MVDLKSKEEPRKDSGGNDVGVAFLGASTKSKNKSSVNGSSVKFARSSILLRQD